MKLVTSNELRESASIDEGIGKADQGKAELNNNIELIVFIGGMQLERECFVQSMTRSHEGVGVYGFSSVDAFSVRDAYTLRPDVIVLKLDWNELLSPTVAKILAQLRAFATSVPIVALTDLRDFKSLPVIRKLGIRGIIPTDIGIEFFMPALKLSLMGRVLLWSSPSHTVRSGQSDTTGPPPPIGGGGGLTPREAMVAEALRSGKSNKVIAHELDIRESTVKVHIGRILRKLDVTNRTAAAFEISRRERVDRSYGAASENANAEVEQETSMLRFNRSRSAIAPSKPTGTA